MALIKKAALRKYAASVLSEKGYEVVDQTGQGILAGARITATKKGQKPLHVAVRTSYERALSFSRLSEREWRTLRSVDLVLAVVPSQNSSQIFEVLAFKSKVLKSVFNKALLTLKRLERIPSLEVPIFVPLDKDPGKNFGHGLSGLREQAEWTVSVGAEALKSQLFNSHSESFIERVKREFAEINEVDVSRVLVEFKILG
jgi:hypothetical protein